MSGGGPNTDLASVEVVALTAEQLDLLANYDFAAASKSFGMPAPPYLLNGQWSWQNFATLMRHDPQHAWWRTQYLVVTEHLGCRRIVGHARLHYYAEYGHYVESESSGEVHIGWATDPIDRGNGYAQAAASELIELTEPFEWVHTVVALVSDDNHASQAVADRVGFARDGNQVHRFGPPMQRWIYRIERAS